MFAGDAVIAGLVDHDIERRVEYIQVEFLGDQSDTCFCGFDIRIDVVPEYFDLAGSLVDQGTDNADRRGLARTVRPEQGIEVAGFDVEIYTLQGLKSVAVSLGKLFDR